MGRNDSWVLNGDKVIGKVQLISSGRDDAVGLAALAVPVSTGTKLADLKLALL